MSTPPLRVLIDATPIPANRGGVGRYVDEVVKELVKLPLTIIIVAQPYDVELFRNIGVQAIPRPRWMRRTAYRFLWEQIGLPRLAKKVNADVIHSIHYTSPLFTRIPRVTTIHDLTFFSHPQFHSRLKGMFFRFWLRNAAQHHRTLIADSEATADAFHKQFPQAQSPIIVAQLASDPHIFRLPTPPETAALKAHIDPPPTRWIAFLGTLEPRKNVPGLIAAYIHAMNALPPSDRPALLIAGAQGWDATVAQQVHKATSQKLDVRLLGYLPLHMLSAFLGNAELVVYPSFGEGFGLPVLEAMATGAAVLTTRNLSLPEVGGDAVFYTDTDVASMSAAIQKLLHDKTARETAKKRALARAAEFSWKKTAHQHMVAYTQAADRF